MESILTIRIDAETERKLRRLARDRKTSRSALIREALRRLAASEPPSPAASAYTAAADLIGSYRSGRGDLSSATGRRFGALLRARR
jgi:hypothetical protein